MSGKTFKVGDKVQFKDGRHTRTAVVLGVEEANDTHPAGYTLTYRRQETGQTMHIRYAASDVSAAGPDSFVFKVDDKVAVMDSDVTGKVFERKGINADRLEPQYGVLYKDNEGKSDLAWWGESMLSAAS